MANCREKSCAGKRKPTAKADLAAIQSDKSETRDRQSGSNLLNFLEAGVDGHSGPGDVALDVSEHRARFVVLINRECSRGCHPLRIKSQRLLNACDADQDEPCDVIR